MKAFRYLVTLLVLSALPGLLPGALPGLPAAPAVVQPRLVVFQAFTNPT